jgi:uncharacterized protein YggE
MSAILGVLILLAASAARAQSPSDPPVIVTSGQAAVERAPDMAWVAIAAETRAREPRAAQQAAADAMTAVLAALRGTGIADADVRTTGYSLQPDMDHSGGRARVVGYIARNQIEVRVRDLARLGPVIDAAGASGATSMSGLRFDLADRDQVEREALRRAVEDAMGRAKAIADGAGAALGPIVRIDEQRAFRPAYAREAMQTLDAAAATPVSPGELHITAQVTLTVGIR